MRNWIIRFLKVAGVLMVTLVLAEICFRFYVIEFYSVELNALNSENELDDSARTDVLFLGDSFTANANSYVAKLRERLPFKMVNSAVSGTGILETSFMAPSRLKKFRPKIDEREKLDWRKRRRLRPILDMMRIAENDEQCYAHASNLHLQSALFLFSSRGNVFVS